MLDSGGIILESNLRNRKRISVVWSGGSWIYRWSLMLITQYQKFLVSELVMRAVSAVQTTCMTEISGFHSCDGPLSGPVDGHHFLQQRGASTIRVKVKQSRYRPGQAQRVPAS